MLGSILGLFPAFYGAILSATRGGFPWEAALGVVAGLFGGGLLEYMRGRSVAKTLRFEQPNKAADLAIEGLQVLVAGLQAQLSASDAREATLRIEIAELRGKVQALEAQLLRPSGGD